MRSSKGGEGSRRMSVLTKEARRGGRTVGRSVVGGGGEVWGELVGK